jgi:hypothetical protein
VPDAETGVAHGGEIDKGLRAIALLWGELWTRA